MKVCHFTSAHSPTDDRIYLKECQSLSQAGHEVFIVAKGEKNGEEGNIHFVGCGTPKNRLARLCGFSKKIYKTALALDCEIYHFHDPELLPYGKKLKRKGKKVIFDSHEDVPAQILDKHWIPGIFRGLVSRIYRCYETSVVKKIDAVITSTPYIENLFKNRAKKVLAINNYPKLNDIFFQENAFENREAIVCYVGGINEDRGEKIMVDAIHGINAELILAGTCDDERYGERVENVKYLGKINRAEVNALYKSAVVGLCLLKPTANYIHSQPIKMYEYMAAGIPFVCSNFPMWEQVVEKTGAGICVDVENISDIQSKIVTLLNDRTLAQKMGKNGRSAVESEYNWEAEGAKLIDFYQKM